MQPTSIAGLKRFTLDLGLSAAILTGAAGFASAQDSTDSATPVATLAG